MFSLRRLLIITFIESFATICVERAIYFLAQGSPLNFSGKTNLWLALSFGLAYVIGAVISHGLARRLSEKRLLMACIWAQLLTHLALAALWQRPEFVFTGSTVIGLLNGLKWPVIESYVCAGQSPARQARSVGLFNIAWSVAVPLQLLVAGTIISAWPAALFLIPAGLNLVAMVLCLPLESRPEHLAPDSPHRPSAEVMRGLGAILTGTRWLLLVSYAAMWVLAALMPGVFSKLGYDVRSSTAMSGLMDAVRVATFVSLQFYSGWHWRLSYLIAAMAGLPVGFFMVLFGPHIGIVLAGEVIFGLSASMVYYSSLYYAMVVKNASVSAGGAHEGLIGLGFFLGPIAGLLGFELQRATGSYAAGMLVGIGPVFVVCFAAATAWLSKARSLRQLRGTADSDLPR